MNLSLETTQVLQSMNMVSQVGNQKIKQGDGKSLFRLKIISWVDHSFPECGLQVFF